MDPITNQMGSTTVEAAPSVEIDQRLELEDVDLDALFTELGNDFQRPAVLCNIV